jgi:hypothetical protein
MPSWVAVTATFRGLTLWKRLERQDGIVGIVLWISNQLMRLSASSIGFVTDEPYQLMGGDRGE